MPAKHGGALTRGNGVDMVKLSHLVQKVLKRSPETSREVSAEVEYVVQELRAQYPEYLRKDLQVLSSQVQLIVLDRRSADQNDTPKKRKIEEQQEQQYDEEAAENDLVREQYGGGLNATLCNRYKQQRTQDEKKKRKIIKKKGGSKVDPMEAGADFLSPVPRPRERYSDLGGMQTIIQEIRQLVEYPVLRPELYKHLGVDPPRGVLLRGPPGTGKTHLANAVAGQLGIPYFRVSAPELVSGMSGESEGRIRDLFRMASESAPSLIFLDELDAIAQKRSDAGSTRGMEKRMVAQLLTCMDTISPENNLNESVVIVLAATNRPDSMDPALRRAGRFDKEILIGVPDEDAREIIIKTMTSGMRLAGDFDFRVLARKTSGFVGADIRSLTNEAAVVSINRIFENVLKDQVPSTNDGTAVVDDADTSPNLIPLTAGQMEPLYVTMDDFLSALPHVQPSSKREGFATVPDVSWEKIGALQSIREELTMSVLEPIRSPEKFKALGLTLPAGVLLYGPPGCGKTLLAKAIAHESGANFISVKGPELLDKYVGESERAVRLVFERARSSSPCIVFFDELDSLVPKRGMDGGSGGVSERVVNQLLTEMDGLESRRSVFVIAATNRPELIDPAMLRPGRLDKLLYVPLPSPEDRASILKALAKNVAIGDDVDLTEIGKSSRADGYSGADCSALLREAGLAVLKENSSTPGVVSGLCIESRHFDMAFHAVLPSVSKADHVKYNRIRERMARARTRAAVDENGPESARDSSGENSQKI